MTPTEELLRSAVREAAGEIRPASIGPLDLTAIRRSGSRRMAWLLPVGPLGRPLAAAVAVAAVVGLSVALPQVLTGNGAPASGTGPASGITPQPVPDPAGTVSPSVLTPWSSGTARPTGVPTDAVDGIPPYYVALTGTAAPYQDHPLALTVRNTVTGQILATAAPPAGNGTFSLVAPGSDNTTFLVGAEPWDPNLISAPPNSVSPPPVGLFLARYDPAAGALTLTRLPVPLVPVNEVEGMAMSPDGRELALAVRPVPSDSPLDKTGELDLRVYPLYGGTVRTWSLHGPAAAASGFVNVPMWNGALSWRPDGHTVAFNWIGTSAPGGGLRLLDTAGPGGDLITASRPLITMPEKRELPGIDCSGNLMLAADGHSASCAGTAREKNSFHYGFYDVSLPDGAKLSGTDFDGPGEGGSQGILWYSGTRGTLIGTFDGKVFVMRDDVPTVSLPWDSRITSPSGALTDAAW
jgi:hypothetical protein